MADTTIGPQGEQKPIRPSPINPDPVDFGPNVIIFDPNVTTIQAQTQSILNTQKSNQFGSARYAFFFKPGVYNNLTLEIGYYTTVHGLGASPDDVTISGGGVQSLGQGANGTALENFWRGVENLSVVPFVADVVPQNLNIWAVSQATYMRRVHIKGAMILSDPHFDFTNQNFSSGGFIADSVVDTKTISRTQQQFLTRNTDVGDFPDGVWNMVFVGDLHPPAEQAAFGTPGPGKAPYTVIQQTPIIREKPYLTISSDGTYSVQLPNLATNTQGPTWTATQPGAATTLPISNFYIVKPAPNSADNAPILNQKLQDGYHLILTPGVYHLTTTLHVTHPNTVILGLGLATLLPTNGTAALKIADVAGVTVCGLLFDAGAGNSPSLFVVGPPGSSTDHSANPTALYDISCRVGGATSTAAAANCVTVNSHNVIMDNVWIWRADHALNLNPAWTGWEVNPSDNGITVNGDKVTAYGLFVEHFRKYQTVWNGNNGSTYFYQSEAPYDVPSQAAWTQPSNELGFSSYKVGDNVQVHTAKGLGVYCFFNIAPVQLENAISTPTRAGINMHHMVTVWLNGAPNTLDSSINHIINGQGAKVIGPQPGTSAFL